jgi:hypothetical protein
MSAESAKMRKGLKTETTNHPAPTRQRKMRPANSARAGLPPTTAVTTSAAEIGPNAPRACQPGGMPLSRPNPCSTSGETSTHVMA